MSEVSSRKETAEEGSDTSQQLSPVNELTGQKKGTETADLPSLGDGANEQDDQPKASLIKESADLGAGGAVISKDKINTNMDQDAPVYEEAQQEESDIALKLKLSGDLAFSSASTSEESNSDAADQAGVENRGSPEGEIAPPTKGGPPHEDSRTTSQTKDSNEDGDHNREMTTKIQPTVQPEIPINELTGQKKGTETTDLPSLGDGANEQVDQPKASLIKESAELEYTNIGAGGDRGRDTEPDFSEKKVSEEEVNQEKQNEQRRNVENIGFVTQETTESTVAVVTTILRENAKFLIPVVLAFFVAFFLMAPHPPESPPRMNKVDILLRQMEKVKTRFPHQRAELWKRSKIHLKRHLQTAQPTAPVNVILTAGLKGERTLRCLAQNLASAFSFAVNGSVLHIDGAGAASQDSDQVKLDIDSKLQGAFEGNKPVAVIHRFEELPPGSTLIFYRYCDHENAAYKGTVLIFTVLLEEEEIPSKIPLNYVEEMVDDHLKKKFLSHSHPVSFDRMDLDKYGGLWSRISHLILPVAAEERIEHEGCWGT